MAGRHGVGERLERGRGGMTSRARAGDALHLALEQRRHGG